MKIRPIFIAPLLIILRVPIDHAEAQTKARSEAILKGHRGAISSVAMTSDGKRIVSGGEDRTVRIWSVETGAEIRTMNGHKSQVVCVAISPDGKRVVSGDKDKMIKIWDADSGEEVFGLTRQKSAVTGLAFSPDGKFIVSTGADRALQVWEAEKNTAIRTLNGYQLTLTCLAFSPHGQRVVAGSADEATKQARGGIIKVFELANGHVSVTLGGMTGGVNSVAFSPDEKLIASASGDPGKPGELRLWDTDEGSDPVLLTGHTGMIHSVAFSPDGKRVVSGGADKTIRLWDPVKGTEIGAFKGHSLKVTSVAFSPDGKSVVSGSADGTVRIWDADNSSPPLAAKGNAKSAAVSIPKRGHGYAMRDLPREVKVPVATPLLTLGGKSQVQTAAFSPDGKQIITGSRESTLKLWDAEKGTEIRTFSGHGNEVRGVAFSPDGTHVASASGDGTVKVWEVENGKEVLTIKVVMNYVNGVAFTPDGKQIATAASGNDGPVKVWDAATGKLLQAFKAEGENVWSRTVAFSPDGKLIAADYSTIVKVWEVESGKLVWSLVGHSGNVSGLAFSPDGKRIVSSGGRPSVSGEIKVWNVETGSEMLALKGHRKQINTVAFSPDGQLIASSAADHFIKLWNAEKGTEIGTINGGPNAWLTTVAFSPDGQRIVSPGPGAAQVWSVDQAKPIPAQTEEAKKNATPNNPPRVAIRGSARALSALRKFQEEQAAKQGITLPPGDGPVVIENGQMRSVPQLGVQRQPTGGPLAGGAGGPMNNGIRRPGGPLAVGGPGGPLVAPVMSGNWAEAAMRYAKRFSGIHKVNNGEPGFEWAAVTLLSGDVQGYRNICEELVERSGTQQVRPYHVARACTLAPDSVKDLAVLEEKANSELKRSSEFWSLTEEGALAYRAGRMDDAADLFEQSLKAENKPSRAMLNWLWLSMVEARRGNRQQAKTQYNKAAKYMDQVSQGSVALPQNVDGLHLHDWLEAIILRREAKTLIGR
jgi:WD40 repeat protein